MQKRLNKAAAFTLLELLVLIGVLLPALRGARLASQRTACAANLRQVGIAMRAYAGANRDALPWATFSWFEGPGVIPDVAWDDLLDPYLGRLWTDEERIAPFAPRANRVLQCPSDHVELAPNPAIAVERYKRSYAMILTPLAVPDGKGMWFEGSGGQMAHTASLATTPWQNIRGHLSAKLSWFRAAAETLLIVEYPEDRNAQGSGSGSSCWEPRAQVNAWRPGIGSVLRGPERVITLHGNRWNYLFADGHVALMKMEETVRPATSYPESISKMDFMWTRRTTD